MSYIPKKTSTLPVLGLLEKNDPTNPETLENQNIGNINLTDNSNSTDSGNLNLNNKNALVFAQFSREDELNSSSLSILIGDNDDETRLARVIGNSSNSVQYKFQSSSVAIDMISSDNGLNIRKHYSNSDTDTIDYGDGTYIFFIRSSE